MASRPGSENAEDSLNGRGLLRGEQTGDELGVAGEELDVRDLT